MREACGAEGLAFGGAGVVSGMLSKMAGLAATQTAEHSAGQQQVLPDY